MVGDGPSRSDPLGGLVDELAALPRGERAARLRATGTPAEHLTRIIDHAAALTMQQTGAALETTALVVDLADDVGDGSARAQARRIRARTLAYAGRFEDALRTCREAVDIATGADDMVEAGRARLASMHALGELGRLDEARDAGQEAREIFVAIDRPALAARADINLGIIHHRHEQSAQALRHFDRARPLLADDAVMLGHLDNSRGEALVAVNDFAGAERAFEDALRAFDRCGATLTAAIAESNLADLAAREGRLQRSLYYFECARRHLEDQESPAVLARLLAEQAEAKTVLGLPAEALRDYRSALDELDRYGLRIEAARARAGMGDALFRLGRLSEAETALAAATVGFDELGHRIGGAKADLVRAEVALADGRAREARRLATRALGVLDERPANAATARLVLARAALSSGDRDAARADLAAALVEARRLDLAPLLAELHEERGRLNLEDGASADAIADLTAAVEQIDRVRGALQAERFRAAFQSDRVGGYEALVAAYLDRGGCGAVDDAFAATERARSRGLLEAVQTSLDHDQPESSDTGADNLGLRRGQLRSELNVLYSRLAEERGVGGVESTADAARDWRDAVGERERALVEIEARLATTRHAGWLYAQPSTLDAVRGDLDADACLIEYFNVDGRLLAFVIEPTRATVFRNLADVREVAARLSRLRFQMDRVLLPGPRGRHADRCLADAQRELGALDAMVFAPLRHRLVPGARLTIVPHGPLHGLPFPALWDGERYLLERHPVHVVPSASLLSHLRRRGRADRPSAGPLVVGVADAFAPRIEAEAAEVARAVGCEPARLLVGADATAERVSNLVPSAGLIHFACHGRYVAGAHAASGLRLADRWLTVRDLCELRIDAELVTLSGCETGLGDVKGGDEVLGLLRSLFAAGAKSLIASLWQVDDETTTKLMDRLYKRLHNPGASGGDAAAHHGGSAFRPLEALRIAQLETRDEHPHPAHWAPFFLGGLP